MLWHKILKGVGFAPGTLTYNLKMKDVGKKILPKSGEPRIFGRNAHTYK